MVVRARTTPEGLPYHCAGATLKQTGSPVKNRYVIRRRVCIRAGGRTSGSWPPGIEAGFLENEILWRGRRPLGCIMPKSRICARKRNVPSNILEPPKSGPGSSLRSRRLACARGYALNRPCTISVGPDASPSPQERSFAVRLRIGEELCLHSGAAAYSPGLRWR